MFFEGIIALQVLNIIVIFYSNNPKVKSCNTGNFCFISIVYTNLCSLLVLSFVLNIFSRTESSLEKLRPFLIKILELSSIVYIFSHIAYLGNLIKILHAGKSDCVSTYVYWFSLSYYLACIGLFLLTWVILLSQG